MFCRDVRARSGTRCIAQFIGFMRRSMTAPAGNQGIQMGGEFGARITAFANSLLTAKELLQRALSLVVGVKQRFRKRAYEGEYCFIPELLGNVKRDMSSTGHWAHVVAMLRALSSGRVEAKVIESIKSAFEFCCCVSRELHA